MLTSSSHLLWHLSHPLESEPYNDRAEDSGQHFIEAINMARRNPAKQILFVLRSLKMPRSIMKVSLLIKMEPEASEIRAT